MAQYPSDKKRDVGYKFSAGILSTDADFDWFAESCVDNSSGQTSARFWPPDRSQAYSTSLFEIAPE